MRFSLALPSKREQTYPQTVSPPGAGLLGEMANSRSEAGKAQEESALLCQEPGKDVFEDSRVCTDSHRT